jgi:acyl-CoA synthetase (AMP-forming)/AMP-acid ligase II
VLIDCTRGQVRTLTLAQLERAIHQASTLLADSGLVASDRILVFHPMAADLYIALGAMFRLGVVAQFVDPSMGRAFIERCCALAPPRGLLATPKAHLLRFVSPALRRIPLKFATGYGVLGAQRWNRWQQLPPITAPSTVTGDTPALATFTSGSTGAPKMAVRSHAFLRTQHDVITATMCYRPGDIVLSTLPIFVLSHLAAGLCVLIPDVDIRYPGRVQPGPLVRQIAQYGVTGLEGSPAFLEQIARYCRAKGRTLPGITQIYTGGAPVFPVLLEQLQQIAPNAAIVAVYGSTEAEPMAEINWAVVTQTDLDAMLAGKGLLAGAPVDAIRLCILPNAWGTPIGPYTLAEFAARCLGPGLPGEIVVSGPHVLSGYWQGQGDQETKFRVGAKPTGETVWHRTGDAGYLDRAGRLWLLGRCAARIEDPRGTLYPFAVECAARRLPEVKHAALISQGGRRLLALELYAGDEAGIRVALMRDLAWAQLDDVRFLRHMPVDKRHNAKIDYVALRRALA